jgi:hypothetical protein
LPVHATKARKKKRKNQQIPAIHVQTAPYDILLTEFFLQQG